jgi:hypothetical protein
VSSISAATYGNAEEKEIVKSSLCHIEQDILHIDKFLRPSAGTFETAFGRTLRQPPTRGFASYFKGKKGLEKELAGRVKNFKSIRNTLEIKT